MCGIIGYTGSDQALPILLEGLETMQYRGYDSTGIALLDDYGKIHIRKTHGKIHQLKISLHEKPLPQSTIGIGHTRWATHGAPNERNAHPHQVGHLVLVHNGIIENYIEIKDYLATKHLHPVSETDTEIFGLLLLDFVNRGYTLKDALSEAFQQVRGHSSVVVLSEKDKYTMIAAHRGSPLVVTQSTTQNNVFIASDVQALIRFNTNIFFLEEQDLCVASPQGFYIEHLTLKKQITRNAKKLDWSSDQLDKNGFDHYMMKEILEQPDSIQNTLTHLFALKPSEQMIFKDSKLIELFQDVTRIHFIACGSSYHAALLGKYWIEKWARISVHVELASEFRYRDPVIHETDLVIGISQSGETADTLSAIKSMKSKGIKTLGICNRPSSSLEREVDYLLFTQSGPEIGVAATKTFATQLITLAGIALTLACKPALNLWKIPHILLNFLSIHLLTKINHMVKHLPPVTGFFFIGRGYNYPIALEGALKLKEITYDPSEGYAAGELKHGPIAMVDHNMAIIVLAPHDAWREKTLSNLQEMKARDGLIIGIGAENDQELIQTSDYFIGLPSSSIDLHMDYSAFLTSPILQLFSYYRGLLKGTDIDQPRNLAKSVTVE
jgi:glucosamine--fructose-6-phosphate aminotransferase (isomerizing)